MEQFEVCDQSSDKSEISPNADRGHTGDVRSAVNEAVALGVTE